ncbi:transcriptional regulator [Halogeometricum pallidum JCM 14848]|uniref:Transcriptional regulator n=1 Tax=Halogeometricum pallidum JCM 14848 TaxID=1227487 RepID=M0CS91_HALPD|nr:transcriptional regulator [Halogeometricum pallidum]ELZ26130.1 transcriptional regulator [Halogeometricum pallidum JCM 14848]
MNTPLDEIEFLARSDHRVEVLNALAERPCDRTDLRAATGASSPTMGRILTDFEDRRWIDRDGRTYVLTRLGEFVTGRFTELREAMATERKLRDVVPWLPCEMDGFTVDMFADATVSYPGPGYPYEPVERVTQLIENAESMRGFGTTIVKSSNLEAACRAIIDGMEFEFIYSPGVLETIIAWDPEKVAEADACGNCTTFVHDSLPDSDWCGLGIYDDRVGICCHDLDTGMLTAVVDTDSPAALAWATSVYERYRNEARRIDDGIAVT